MSLNRRTFLGIWAGAALSNIPGLSMAMASRTHSVMTTQGTEPSFHPVAREFLNKIGEIDTLSRLTTVSTGYEKSTNIRQRRDLCIKLENWVAEVVDSITSIDQACAFLKQTDFFSGFPVLSRFAFTVPPDMLRDIFTTQFNQVYSGALMLDGVLFSYRDYRTEVGIDDVIGGIGNLRDSGIILWGAILEAFEKNGEVDRDGSLDFLLNQINLHRLNHGKYSVLPVVWQWYIDHPSFRKAYLKSFQNDISDVIDLLEECGDVMPDIVISDLVKEIVYQIPRLDHDTRTDVMVSFNMSLECGFLSRLNLRTQHS